MAIAYFFSRYVTDEGITLTWYEEAGKFLVTNLIGAFGVLFLFTGTASLISSFVFFGNQREEK